MPYSIPLLSQPAQQFNIVLDGQNCTFFLYQRLGRLFMDLAVDGEMVFSGRLCLTGVPVKLYRHEPFSGQLFFVDMEGDSDPDYTGLQDRYRLVYFREEEL